MKKVIAVFCLCTALMGFTMVGNQAPLFRQTETEGTYEGVLEDKNANVMVVRDAQGDSRLFWMTGSVACDAREGEQVEVTFTGDPTESTQVLQVTGIRRI